MAQVVVEMTGKEAQLWQSFQRIVQQQTKVEGGFKKVAKAGKTAGKDVKRAGKDSKDAFGGDTLSALTAYVGGLLSAGAAIGTIVKGLRAVREMQQGAGQRITDEVSGRRALLQLAPTTERFEFLKAEATRMRTQYGYTPAKGHRITFAAESAGQVQNLDLYAQLKDINFDAEAGVEAVQKIHANFGGAGAGRTGGGTARQILNKIMAAAGPSPVQAEKFARASSIAATSWGGIVGQDETLLAALSALAVPFKTPEQAAQVIKSLSAQLAKKRHLIDLSGGYENLGGMELISALDWLGEEGRLKSESGEVVDVRKFLGEMNAIEAHRQFGMQWDVIQKNLRNIELAESQTGTDKGLLAKRFAMAEEDTNLASVKAAEIAEQQLNVVEEVKYGPLEKRAEAKLDRMRARAEREGGPGARWVKEQTWKLDKWATGAEHFLLMGHERDVDPEAYLQDLNLVRQHRGENPHDERGNEGLDRLIESAEKLSHAADKLEQAAAKTSLAVGSGPTLSRGPDDDPGRSSFGVSGVD